MLTMTRTVVGPPPPYWAMRGRPESRAAPGSARRGCLALLLASCSSSPSPTAGSKGAGPRRRPPVPRRRPPRRRRPRPWPRWPRRGRYPGRPDRAAVHRRCRDGGGGPDGAVFVSPQNPTALRPPSHGSSTATVRPKSPSTSGRCGRPSRGRHQLLRGHLHQRLLLRPSQWEPDGQWNLPPINAANASDEDLVSLAAAGGTC